MPELKQSSTTDAAGRESCLEKSYGPFWKTLTNVYFVYLYIVSIVYRILFGSNVSLESQLDFMSYTVILK